MAAEATGARAAGVATAEAAVRTAVRELSLGLSSFDGCLGDDHSPGADNHFAADATNGAMAT